MNKALKTNIDALLDDFNFDVVEYGLSVIVPSKNLEMHKNETKWIYPASIYKVFIAAEVLRQISENVIKGDTKVEIRSHNAVDKEVSQFTDDTRPILRAGDRISIDYLLDLMCYRSDNTAANVLIDVVSRESINENIIQPYGFCGGEITRKFLSREHEDPQYINAPITMSCASHIARFFALVERGEMINNEISRQIKSLHKKITTGAWREGAAENTGRFTKGGWYESINSQGQTVRWRGDSGIVSNNNITYCFALLTLTKSSSEASLFPIAEFGKLVHQYILNY